MRTPTLLAVLHIPLSASGRHDSHQRFSGILGGFNPRTGGVCGAGENEDPQSARANIEIELHCDANS